MLSKDPTPIAVTSRSFSRHPILREEVQARFSDVKFNDEGKSLAGLELAEFLRGRKRAITALEKIDDSILAAVPELELISKYGVGLDMLDQVAMQRRGVRLGWRGGVNRRSVSELTLGLMLSCLRKIVWANGEVRAGRFQQVTGSQLTGKTVGVIGCGYVGSDLLSLLRPFNVKILVNDIIDVGLICQEYGAQAVDLENLLVNSDIVSLHIPRDATTENLLNRERLQSMRRGAILINTARGGIVDEKALKDFLRDGHLGAAAFDVFDPEPPRDRELVALPNFIATPHIGGSSEEAILAMGRAAIEGLSS